MAEQLTNSTVGVQTGVFHGAVVALLGVLWVLLVYSLRAVPVSQAVVCQVDLQDTTHPLAKLHDVRPQQTSTITQKSVQKKALCVVHYYIFMCPFRITARKITPEVTTEMSAAEETMETFPETVDFVSRYYQEDAGSPSQGLCSPALDWQLWCLRGRIRGHGYTPAHPTIKGRHMQRKVHKQRIAAQEWS